MIILQNVTKIYKAKKVKDCVAVNDVSFVLPDKGLVFIVGKSGSGKSTLLNLIGGLDNCTKGSIIANGNDITKLKHNEINNYRRSHIGFVFQDYHVLDNLTVRENIELSLDIANIEDKKRIDDILEKVELEELQDRYPKELSGGQKQRIAIARALVKDADIILCDEPTGNLDRKTSTQILQTLKDISENKLVLIVSHSSLDANNYANRIIELFDGKIIRDRERRRKYSNDFKIENNIVYLPHYRDLDESEVFLINNELQNNKNIQFKQINNRYYTTEIEANLEEKKEILPSKFKRKTGKKLYKMFFARKKFALMFNIFLASLIFVCFAIFQSLLSFNANRSLSEALEYGDTYIIPLQKGSLVSNELSLTYLNKVSNEDIKNLQNGSVEGTIYKKYNTTLPIQSTSIDSESGFNVSQNLNMFYTKETYGVINCDEEFLITLFGQNGKIKYLALAEEQKEFGQFIPDYLADSILFYSTDKTKKYEDILGYYEKSKIKYGYINGIFDTDYESKYGELKTKIEEAIDDPDEAGKYYNEIKEDKIYLNFSDEAMTYLCYGYNFSEDYSKAIQTNEFRDWMRIGRFNVSALSKEVYSKNNILIYDVSRTKKTLGEGEILMGVSTYNTLFNTNYTSKDVIEPHTITFKFFNDRYKMDEIIYEKTLTVVGFVSGTSSYANMSDLNDIREQDCICYGLYLEDFFLIDQMLDIASECDMIVSSIDATRLSTINRMLEVFHEFFSFVQYLFFAIALVFLINIGFSSIKKNYYEIGVLKAIGVSSVHIMKLFIKRSIVNALYIVFVSIIGIYIGTKFANSLLISAFEQVLDIKLVGIALIKFIPELVLLDSIIICVLSIISFLFPQISLFKIRPIKIIRAKE